MLKPPRLLLLLAMLSGFSAGAADEISFTMRTLPAQMKYDLTELVVPPGARVRLSFENNDDMPHNVAFCDIGTDVVAMCNKQMEQPELALKRNWIPDDKRIWLHSKNLDPKTKELMEFQAPTKPGSYPYVCTFPGHAMIMNGVLKVVLPGTKLKDLTFAMYLGDWDKLPDFTALKPHREGELENGLVEIQLDDYKNQFGVVYKGTLEAPKKGEYQFFVSSDDGSRLLIDGKQVIKHDGIHPASDVKEAKVKLEKGIHQVQLEYFQAAGHAQIFLGWKGPDFTFTPLSTWQPKAFNPAKPKADTSVGMPLVVNKDPLIYRNFISGAGNRGIGVGYPGGIHFAWSAEAMDLAIVWRGAFMDAAKHWRARGGGFQPPLGFDVFRPSELGPPFAVLTSSDATWPTVPRGSRAEGYRWKGYRIDAAGNPTFQYEWSGIAVSDHFSVEGNGLDGSGKLHRIIRLAGKAPKDAVLRVASVPTGKTIKPAGSGWLVESGPWEADGGKFGSSFLVEASGAQLVGNLLVLPLGAELKMTYSWPGAHPSAHGKH